MKYIVYLVFSTFYAVSALFPLQAWRKKKSQEKAGGENYTILFAETGKEAGWILQQLSWP